jgi:hypothetical protein
MPLRDPVSAQLSDGTLSFHSKKEVPNFPAAFLLQVQSPAPLFVF